MWFLFGFLTLATFAFYSLFEWWYSGWRGDPMTVGPHTYRSRLRSASGKPTGVRIGVNAPGGYFLALRPKRWANALTKWTGLTIECQMRDPVFGEGIQIISNDTRLCSLLRNDSVVKRAVRKLFDSANGLPCRVQQLRCGAGRLWIEYRATRGFNRDTALALGRRVAPVLAALATRLDEGARGIGNRFGDRFVWRATLLLAISTGLAVNGIVHWPDIADATIPFTLDNGELWKLALLGGGSVVAALLTLAVIAVGYSARAHLVIAELLLVGGFGAIMTGFVELRDINMALDTGSASVIETVALDKHVNHATDRYVITVQDWTDPGRNRDIDVPRELYEQFGAGSRLTIRQRSGYLGFRWVEDIDPTRRH